MNMTQPFPVAPLALQQLFDNPHKENNRRKKAFPKMYHPDKIQVPSPRRFQKATSYKYTEDYSIKAAKIPILITKSSIP